MCWPGVTLAQLVKASVGQADVQRFEPHLVHNQNINSGKTGIACFLDLSKGFDTLNTDILLHKLNKHGINYEITWFESYLTNRKQIVLSNNILSDINTVNVGVPQGTVLGPIVFLIYMNDFSSVIENDNIIASLYADEQPLEIT